MQPKVVYWERQSYSETGFKLIEITEDGRLSKRTFIHQSGEYKDMCFSSKDCEDHQIPGVLKIEKINFGQDQKLKLGELAMNIEVIETHDIKDWQKAREKIQSLQKESAQDFTIDYRLVLILEEAPLKKFVQNTDRNDFIVIGCRVEEGEACLIRKEHHDFFSVEYIPELNEKLYFQFIPENKHIVVSADNIFAIETRQSDHILSDDEFIHFIYEMKTNIQANEDYYRSLILKQRERRAMLETDIIGDLYPR